ncbi:hypothetical protein AAFF_G00423540 [Aldrovandia affinis]|uniref:Uncharacterized protein n=1 Tax=Aldrovandia affinis TaxID=143900 RepID=A0AAD7T6I6_9TELE|nr:hypothetical protein AAFF_G00423540 [Aldrovandia affinis]
MTRDQQKGPASVGSDTGPHSEQPTQLEVDNPRPAGTGATVAVPPSSEAWFASPSKALPDWAEGGEVAPRSFRDRQPGYRDGTSCRLLGGREGLRGAALGPY